MRLIFAFYHGNEKEFKATKNQRKMFVKWNRKWITNDE